MKKALVDKDVMVEEVEEVETEGEEMAETAEEEMVEMAEEEMVETAEEEEAVAETTWVAEAGEDETKGEEEVWEVETLIQVLIKDLMKASVKVVLIKVSVKVALIMVLINSSMVDFELYLVNCIRNLN